MEGLALLRMTKQGQRAKPSTWIGQLRWPIEGTVGSEEKRFLVAITRQISGSYALRASRAAAVRERSW